MSFYKNLSLFLINWLNCISCISRKIVTNLTFNYYFNPKTSIYGLANVGPMYIDTETERLQKGFAFSDIFALGSNYKLGCISLDVKCLFRHVSNANLQKPNFGYNAIGFELGTYYEFN